MVAAGSFTPPGAQTAMTLPAFCRVEATARPTSDSDIKFEVWIPPAEAWNGKFQGVGNGGYSGRDRLRRDGHRAAPRLRDREHRHGPRRRRHEVRPGPSGEDDRLGYRAIHVMTDAAKLIVRNAAGKLRRASRISSAARAGGHQALSEAQRYPDDYDGIIAGDPANNRIRQTFGVPVVVDGDARRGRHSRSSRPAKLSLVTKAAVDACDGIDGLKDGIIDDPRRCHFDPATLLCKAGADESRRA